MDNKLPFIQLNFYDENDEITDTFEKNGVRWAMLKKALRLGNKLNADNFEEKDFDEISCFVCELFNNKFTSKQLEESANFDDVLNIFSAVMKKANAMNINPN